MMSGHAQLGFLSEKRGRSNMGTKVVHAAMNDFRASSRFKSSCHRRSLRSGNASAIPDSVRFYTENAARLWWNERRIRQLLTVFMESG
jgi:hypothetical protein